MSSCRQPRRTSARHRHPPPPSIESWSAVARRGRPRSVLVLSIRIRDFARVRDFSSMVHCGLPCFTCCLQDAICVSKEASARKACWKFSGLLVRWSLPTTCSSLSKGAESAIALCSSGDVPWHGGIKHDMMQSKERNAKDLPLRCLFFAE